MGEEATIRGHLAPLHTARSRSAHSAQEPSQRIIARWRQRGRVGPRRAVASKLGMWNTHGAGSSNRSSQRDSGRWQYHGAGTDSSQNAPGRGTSRTWAWRYVLLKICVDGQADLEPTPIRWCGPGSWSRGARRPMAAARKLLPRPRLTHILCADCPWLAWPGPGWTGLQD